MSNQREIWIGRNLDRNPVEMLMSDKILIDRQAVEWYWNTNTNQVEIGGSIVGYLVGRFKRDDGYYLLVQDEPVEIKPWFMPAGYNRGVPRDVLEAQDKENQANYTRTFLDQSMMIKEQLCPDADVAYGVVVQGGKPFSVSNGPQVLQPFLDMIEPGQRFPEDVVSVATQEEIDNGVLHIDILLRPSPALMKRLTPSPKAGYMLLDGELELKIVTPTQDEEQAMNEEVRPESKGWEWAVEVTKTNFFGILGLYKHRIEKDGEVERYICDNGILVGTAGVVRPNTGSSFNLYCLSFQKPPKVSPEDFDDKLGQLIAECKEAMSEEQRAAFDNESQSPFNALKDDLLTMFNKLHNKTVTKPATVFDSCVLTQAAQESGFTASMYPGLVTFLQKIGYNEEARKWAAMQEQLDAITEVICTTPDAVRVLVNGENEDLAGSIAATFNKLRENGKGNASNEV